VILFGKAFWKPLDKFIANTVSAKFGALNSSERDIYYLTDKIEDIIAIADAVCGIEGHQPAQDYLKQFLP